MVDAQKNHILVTGPSGFVGAQVVKSLLAGGHSLVLAFRDAERCPSALRVDARVRILETGSLEDHGLPPGALDRITHVVHIAGLAHVVKSDFAQDDDPFMHANAEATRRLAAEAAKAGVTAFIHLSSLAAVVPNAVSETITDKTDLGASTPYGRSKRVAEQHVRELAAAGIVAVSLRPPLVVGTEAKGTWRGLQKLAATGAPLPFGALNNRRSFISARSLGGAIVRLCDCTWPVAFSGDYCVADPEPIEVREVVSELRRGMGLRPLLFPVPRAAFDFVGSLTGKQNQFAGLTGDLRVDPTRFFERFGFFPDRSLRKEIAESGAGFRKM